MKERDGEVREGARESSSGVELSLDAARERLREKGYLDRGVEGAVLKGALAARSRTRALLLGAATGALFLAAAVAVAGAVLHAVSSALPLRDAAVLFLWLFAGASALAAFLVAGLVALALLRGRLRGDADEASTEVAVAFGILAGVAGVAAARPALETAGLPGVVAVLAAVALAVLIAVRVARGLAFTVFAASGRLRLPQSRRRRLAGFIAAAAALLAVAAVLLLRPAPPPGGPLVVEANAHRVTVVAVDGWTAEPPAPAGTRASYVKSVLDPAAFWTTVATGQGASRHGIGSLDLVRVAGVGAPLRPLSGAGFYLGRVLPALHLARLESVTAAARRVPAVWEVASRSGIPSLTVNWWTTYPAGDGGGTVLGNHLFFAARAGSSLAGEGWPAEIVARVARLAPRLAPEPGSLERLIEDAKGLDAFAVAAFRDVTAREKPRLSLVYLPGPDILSSALAAPERTAADRVVLAEALTAETAAVRAFLDDPTLLDGTDLVVFVLDAGRREPGGSVAFAGPLARQGAAPGVISASDLAPTVLAVLGVPSARDAAGKVRTDFLAAGAATSETVASWGRRRAGAPPDVDPKEYVENLRSLGYLR